MEIYKHFRKLLMYVFLKFPFFSQNYEVSDLAMSVIHRYHLAIKHWHFINNDTHM